jgi:EAL domain-containing protein (putative c-di-GMP-specific phosphodiesterase class I)
MKYIYQFDVAAIILTLSILYSVLKIRTIQTNFSRTFYLLLVFTTLTSIFDLAACILQSNPLNYSRILLFANKTLYQLAYHSVPVSFFYCIYFTAKKNSRPTRRDAILYNIPFYISMLLVIFNIFVHKVFYFDENNVYHHGPLCFYLYFEAFGYILFSLFYFIKKRKNFPIYQVITIVSYCIIIFISVLIQFTIQNIRIINLILAIAVLISYMALENPAKYEDKDMKLYNKEAFFIKAKDYFDSQTPFYLMKFDFSNLEYFGDYLSNNTYSELTKNISDFFKSIFSKNDLYRYDENTLLIFLRNDHEERNNEIIQIQKRFNSPFKCGQTELTLSYTFHVYNIPHDASKLDELQRCFDKILSSAIALESNNEKNIQSIIGNQLKETEIIDILDKAISENGFELYFQPIYNISKHKFTAAEALVRLKKTSYTSVDLEPDVFIPFAEKYGMITQIGRIIFNQFCNFLVKNKPWNYGIEYINVNLSPIQSIQPQFMQEYLQIMQNYKISPQYVNFEIINSSSPLQNQAILENMKNLRKHNINFFLDSYGKNSKNIISITQFPFYAVKIDKQMVWTLNSDEKSKIILRETISMIKDLGMDVVAEGIESHAQAIELIKMGCNFLQGFYYSEPLPMLEFMQFIR